MPRSSASGGRARAQRSGATGEAIVDALRDAARLRRCADVRPIPTPTVGANGARRFVARSTVDALGYLLDGTARVVAEEVKTCAAKRRFQLREVEPHQAAYLDGVERAGGVAVLTVVYGPARLVSVHAWRDVRTLVSLGPDELAACRVTAATYLARFCAAGAR